MSESKENLNIQELNYELKQEESKSQDLSKECKKISKNLKLFHIKENKEIFEEEQKEIIIDNHELATIFLYIGIKLGNKKKKNTNLKIKTITEEGNEIYIEFSNKMIVKNANNILYNLHIIKNYINDQEKEETLRGLKDITKKQLLTCIENLESITSDLNFTLKEKFSLEKKINELKLKISNKKTESDAEQKFLASTQDKIGEDDEIEQELREIRRQKIIDKRKKKKEERVTKHKKTNKSNLSFKLKIFLSSLSILSLVFIYQLIYKVEEVRSEHDNLKDSLMKLAIDHLYIVASENSKLSYLYGSINESKFSFYMCKKFLSTSTYRSQFDLKNNFFYLNSCCKSDTYPEFCIKMNLIDFIEMKGAQPLKTKIVELLANLTLGLIKSNCPDSLLADVACYNLCPKNHLDNYTIGIDTDKVSIVQI